MDYVSTLLDRYYEIFLFVINSDQYREFIYLKKKALRPYSPSPLDTVASGNGAELPEKADPLKAQVAEGDEVDYFSRLLELHAAIVERVWEKYRHRLINISEWDPKLDKIDVFHLLGGSDPVVVEPTTARHAFGMTDLKQQLNGLERPELFEKLLGIERHEFFTIGIDAQLNRKDAWAQLKAALGDYLGTKKTPRNPKKRTIPKYEVIKLAREGQTFEAIGKRYGVDRSTAHKAFCRDYADIFGSKYIKGTCNRHELPRHQLSKTCTDCATQATCEMLCPEMLAYVRQDDVSLKEQLI